ncbi:uncharacterized protein LOC116603455 isoform X2 [Nematostella vectensis]|uniref:uncharacterized protein LOC116603455 isoform X2 n=1 Tax=Nematostella vectensis TaxID=45351 RepID=UPI0020777ED6|nr:uncharacterized protein LOC116603455 isoform X2 [Nematostella vectensis]
MTSSLRTWVCILLAWIPGYAKSQACSPVTVVTDWTGNLKSPEFPNYYPNNISCSWVLTVSPGNRIEVTTFVLLLDSYSTEDPSCPGDYLEVRQGASRVSPLIGRYCGGSVPPPFVSSSENLFMQFVTDASGSSAGLFLQHKGVCRVQLNETSGTISTPNYPQFYPTSQDCLWSIRVNSLLEITLNITTLDTKHNDNCTFDYVEVYAGVSMGAPLIGRHCGLAEGLSYARRGNLSVRFVSDGDREKMGFLATYTTRLSGTWTEWSPWTPCSVTCHQGNSTRSRMCTDPLPLTDEPYWCQGQESNKTEQIEVRTCVVSNCSMEYLDSSMVFLSATRNQTTPTHFELNVILATAYISAVLSPLTCVGNGALLYILFKDPFKKFRKPTTLFIVSLSLSDFVSGGLTQMLYSARMFMRFYSKAQGDQGLFWTQKMVNHFMINISVLIVTVMSIDRFLSIYKPFKYKVIVTSRRVATCNAIIWVYSVLFTLTSFTMSREVFMQIDLHLHTTLPVLVMIICYVSMYVLIRKKQHRRVNLELNTRSERSLRIQKRVSATVFMVIFLLFIGLMPFFVVVSIGIDFPVFTEEKWFIVMNYTCLPFLFVNSALNPWLYAWRLTDYRQAFFAIFHIKTMVMDITTSRSTNDGSTMEK